MKVLKTFSLDFETVEKFKELAKAKGISMSFIVNNMLRDWIAINQKNEAEKDNGS